MNSEVKQQQLDWRRSRVLELSSEGYSQREIAHKLQVDPAAVNRDIQFLRQQAQENIQKHISEVVPEEYQRNMIGVKGNLRRVLEIAAEVSDPRIKLDAIRVANECYKIIMDLCSNASVVEQALKYVQQKTEQLDKIQTLKMVEERIQASSSEEDKTTDGVY